MVLLDTNVVSELVRTKPETAVQAHLRRYRPEEMFTAAICLAEIRYGLARLPIGRRRTALAASVENLLSGGFDGRILSFDAACAGFYGMIRAEREARGVPIEVEDAMIAATARAHGAALVTRNVADFEHCGITVIDPWEHGV